MFKFINNNNYIRKKVISFISSPFPTPKWDSLCYFSNNTLSLMTVTNKKANKYLNRSQPKKIDIEQ